MSESFVEAFAKARRDALKAFNQGDYETAFADVAPDVQWHVLRSVLETGVLDGRDAVIDYFSSVIEAGSWEVESLEFIDAGGGSVVVHQRGTGTGRYTGIVTTLDFFQIWDVGNDGLVVRVREYERREDALKAAGLSEQAMSEVNVQRLRALYSEWAKGDFRGDQGLFAPDATFEPRTPDQRAALSRAEFADHMRDFLRQWSGFRIEAEQFAEFGDIVLVTERQHAIGKSSGVATEGTFYAAWRFRDGLVVWVYWDASLAATLEAAGLSE